MTVLDDLGALMADHHIAARGVVHVGAHKGEEIGIYRQLGLRPIVLVEPQPALAAGLRLLPGDDLEVIEVACSVHGGETKLFITENTKLSSIFKPINHVAIERVTVQVRRLENLIDDRVNVAVIDAQGAEMETVAGAPLDRLDLIVVETRTKPKYAGAPLHQVAVETMAGFGWRMAAKWSHGGKHKLHDVAFVPEGR